MRKNISILLCLIAPIFLAAQVQIDSILMFKEAEQLLDQWVKESKFYSEGSIKSLQSINKDNLIDTKTISLRVTKSAIAEIDNYLKNNLPRERKRIFKKNKLVFSNIPGYTIIQPVYALPNSNEIVISTKWFVGLLNYVAAIHIDTKFSGYDNFPVFFSYVKVAGDPYEFAFSQARLNRSDTESLSMPMILAFLEKGIQFTYLHELAHIMYPEFEEAQADSFALFHLYNHSQILWEKIEITKDINVQFGNKSKSIRDIMYQSLTALLPSISASLVMDYMISEIALLGGTVENPKEHYKELSDRYINLYGLLAKKMDCGNNKIIDDRRIFLCETFASRAKHYSGFFTGIEYHEGANRITASFMSSSNLMVRNDLDQLNDIYNIDFSENNIETVRFVRSLQYFETLINTFEKDQRQKQCLNYGIYCLSNSYFNENRRLDKLALIALVVGSLIEGDDLQSKELCNLLLARLYEYQGKNKSSAAGHYLAAMKIHKVLPMDFYERSIKYLNTY